MDTKKQEDRRAGRHRGTDGKIQIWGIKRAKHAGIQTGQTGRERQTDTEIRRETDIKTAKYPHRQKILKKRG